MAGGREATGLDVLEWTTTGVARGAGELLLTSHDRDGTREGYDLELLRAVGDGVSVPLIASGGAGRASHLAEALESGASAVLLAGILHDGLTTPAALKDEVTTPAGCTISALLALEDGKLRSVLARGVETAGRAAAGLG